MLFVWYALLATFIIVVCIYELKEGRGFRWLVKDWKENGFIAVFSVGVLAILRSIFG